MTEGRKLYAAYCTGCHGENGKGDGVAARALPVKPADHTDGKTMGVLSDAYLRSIIEKGGAGVGRSSFMPSWGGQLRPDEIGALIAYIRSLARPTQGSGGKQ